MANSEHTHEDDLQDWVDARLATLTPELSYQPVASARLQSIESRRSAARNRRLGWAGTAMATVVVLAAVPGTRAFASRCIETCVGVTTSVSQLWRADEPEATAPRVVGLSIGDIAPDLAGRDRRGEPVRLSALRGRMVVLNFWATWCGPCKAEIPMLNDLQSRFRAGGVEVVGVSVDEGGWQVVDEFVTEQNVGYTIALADEDTTRAFGGVGELPMTLVIDREGRIVVKRIGVLTEGGDYQGIVRLLGR